MWSSRPSGPEITVPAYVDPIRPFARARIAIVTDFLSGLGGTERYTARLAQLLEQLGARVKVWVAEPLTSRVWADLLTAQGIPIRAAGSLHSVPKRGRAGRGRSPPAGPTSSS